MPGLEQAFELAVVISAVDRFTAPARAMATQMGLISKQSQAMQKQMASFKAMAITGGVITGIGGAMALGLTKAVESAGQLQTAMMGVKEAAKLNNAEFQKAMNLSQTIGIPTIFSAEQVGGIMAAMSNAGLSKQQLLDPSILQQYVNFADVQSQIKHENAPDAVAAAVGMAHQYQLYSTAQITPFLNNLNAALLHTNDTASEFATTYKYISNQARSMGMSSTDTLTTTAWLDRMGFGNGRGGTNFADFLQRSIYGSSGAKADAAMQQAGFVANGHSIFTTANGQFVGVPEAVQILQQFGDRFNHNANLMNPLLHAIFGTQGARVAMMMTSAGASEQYVNIQKQIAATSGIDQSQSDMNNTWQGKVKQLQTTLQDIQQAFGRSVMPMLLPIVKALDDMLGRVLEFEQQHPKIMKWISTFAEIATAVMLVVGPVMLLTGAIGYLYTSSSLRAGAQILARSFTGMLGPVAILGLAIYGLYLLWTSNFDNIQGKTQKVFSWFRSQIPALTADMHKFLQAIGFEHDTTTTAITKNGKTAMGVGGSLGTATTRSYQVPGWVKDAAVAVAAWKAMSIAISLARTSLVRFLAQLVIMAARLTIMIMWRSTLLAIRIATMAWSAAQWLLNVAMDANPIGTVIMLIGLLVIGIVALIAKWRSIIEWLKQVWQWYKNLGDNIKLLLALFVPFIGLPALIISKWSVIKTFFSDLWTNYLKPVIDGIANSAVGRWVMNHIFGGSGSSSPTASIPTGAMSGGNTTIHLHAGAIQVNGSTDGGTFAKDFVNNLGTSARQNNMTRPFGTNRLVFNH